MDVYILKKFVSFIDRFNDRIGRIFSVIIIVVIFILNYEVFMRYFLHRPTIWVHEFSAMMYAVFFLIGGVYNMRWSQHLNVDIFYSKLSKKKQAILDLFTYLLFYLFIFIMFWLGSQSAYISVQNWEHSNSVWSPPIWEVKLFIPFVSLLMLLQGLSKTIKDIYFIFSGRDLLISAKKGDEKN